jgi:hypothetical protein
MHSIDMLCCSLTTHRLQGAVFDLKNPADSSAFHAALDRGAAAVASKLLQYLNSSKPTKGSKVLPALPAPSSSGNLSGSGALVPATKVGIVWVDVFLSRLIDKAAYPTCEARHWAVSQPTSACCATHWRLVYFSNITHASVCYLQAKSKDKDQDKDQKRERTRKTAAEKAAEKAERAAQQSQQQQSQQQQQDPGGERKAAAASSDSDGPGAGDAGSGNEGDKANGGLPQASIIMGLVSVMGAVRMPQHRRCCGQDHEQMKGQVSGLRQLLC